MNSIQKRLEEIYQQVEAELSLAQRDQNEVKVLAVSKTKPIQAIEQAYQAGQREFAENYIQEAINKITMLQYLPDITWHFIGPIQSNKTRLIAEHFTWVQTIDRLKIAERLNVHRQQKNPLNILIQVNISAEPQKSGISPAECLDFAKQLITLKKLRLRGIMAIGKQGLSINEQQQQLIKLQQLYQTLQNNFPEIDTLSMGMSQDLSPAIRYGSTMVRIGTGIFGQRENR